MISNDSLSATIAAILQPGKGVLAADESFPTIEKRFKSLQIASTQELRQQYRQLLVTTPGLGEFISGVILFDETLREPGPNKRTFPEMLKEQGIVPGIKVDLSTAALPNFANEKFTQGLDHLRERLAEYRKLGARFTKWRAVFRISETLPSPASVDANATALAIFAALSQEAEMVPIVEPELLMDGSHSFEQCIVSTTRALVEVFAKLNEYRVQPESILLKTGMVLPGKESGEKIEAGRIAQTTVDCFRRSVPAAVPGIVFLSGGQGDVEATERLNAVCQISDLPWKISFSFGRALQAPALAAWNGKSENITLAQRALHHRARCNSLALQGKYTKEIENEFKTPQK
jgi:fructose-bisphosphate aldolase class I